MDYEWEYKHDLKRTYNLVSKRIYAVDDHDCTTLMYSASYHPDIAKALIDAGADINIQSNSGRTALFSAAANGYLELVKTLLDAGADPTWRDNDGHTALVLSACRGHMEIVKLLADAIYKKRANDNVFEIEPADKAMARKIQAAKLNAETVVLENAIMEKIKGGGSEGY